MHTHFILRRFAGVLGLAALAVLTPAAVPAEEKAEITNQEQNIDTYTELLREDIRTQKAAILGVVMKLTPEQAAAFWPIYTDYSKELKAIWDDELDVIKDYRKAYASLTDKEAGDLIMRSLDAEAASTALKKKYAARIQETLSGRVAARFIQVENQLLHLLELQIASNLPIVP